MATAIRRSALPILTAVLVSLPAGTAVAQEPHARADSVADGVGASYWGEIPPAGDSTTARFRNPLMPVWEGLLVVPFRFFTYPVKLVGDGMLATVRWIDETRILNIFFRPPGKMQLMPAINAGGLSGFGGGLTLQLNDVGWPGVQMRLRGYATVNGDQRITFGARAPTGKRSRIVLGMGFRDRANARYFGIGPNSSVFDESFYRQKLTWAGLSYHRDFGSGFTLRGKLLYSRVAAGPPGGDFEPSIPQQFPGSVPPGFGESSDGLSLELLLGQSDDLPTGRPTRGGLRQLRASYMIATDEGDADLWTFRAELQQFIPLWYEYHTLALRGYVSWIQRSGDGEMPFQRLLTNDDPDLLRGFNDFRWRDRGLAVLSAEYRWPLWVFQRADGPGLDMYVLADVGQVFDSFNKISFDNLTLSYGLGIRLVSGPGLVLRLEWARSNEGAVFRLKSEQIFQWTKGLFHGKDPVPPR
ncbi:MAG: BamA/TamA family outer membrane protein [Gemmatimonadales bacterium]